jgi:hypothetical protein
LAGSGQWGPVAIQPKEIPNVTMTLAGLSPGTQATYIDALSFCSRHYFAVCPNMVQNGLADQRRSLR